MHITKREFNLVKQEAIESGNLTKQLTIQKCEK